MRSVVVLTPAAEAEYWRVKLAWPNKTPHFFGKFQTKEEAEHWIAEHHWMSKQHLEPDEPADLKGDEASIPSPESSKT
jgi:hypothetical protein